MRSSIFLKIVNIAKSALPTVLFPVSLFPAIIVMPLNARLACPTFARLSMMSRIIAFSLLNRRRYSTPCFDTMGADTMVKKLFSHYAPRPLQQPQMPDMKQVKRSVCNHISHFSLLSYLPSAGNPSTQPQIRRLALPLIRSTTVIPPTTPHPANTAFSSMWCWCMSSQKRICTCSARAILSVAKFQQDIFDNVAITHQLEAVFRI